MENRGGTCSIQTVALAFLGGVVAGAVAGILLAPKSGEETRRDLNRYARRAEEEVLEKAKEVRVALDDSLQHGKQFMAGKTADVEAALKAGREVVKDKMEKCCC